MKLPLLISVAHAGLRVPPEAQPYSILTPEQIREDGDGGADEIYSIGDEVAAFLTTDIARVFIDLNRARDDRRADGVVKTHTCWNEPVYSRPLPEDVVESLLTRYYEPYHERLAELARTEARLGVDCHTMAAKGPPIGPDPGVERPWICLSNADGTCPDDWMIVIARSFEEAYDHPVSINVPFKGGHITRKHAAEMPWVQLELSRAPFMPNLSKRTLVITALRMSCERIPW